MANHTEFHVDAPIWAWGNVIDACVSERRELLVEFDTGRIESFDSPFGSTSPSELIGLPADQIRRAIWRNDDRYLSRPRGDSLAARRAQYQAKSIRLGAR